ncbi:MAG: hypothetical protein M1831_003374 [Alyxoria varia]|nr:MAG: hypothetical protein M1831_003374 [Alyxoria varia]
MNPHQKNKVDISSLTPEEQRLFRMYGKLPNKKDLLQNKLKERKYFDSGDYALSKAGKASDVGVTQVGLEHPNPENIPHVTSSSPLHNGPSPTTNGPNTGTSANNGGLISPSSAGGVGFGAETGNAAGSPVKESSVLHRGQSVDDQPGVDVTEGQGGDGEPVSPPPKVEGVPIRGAGGR